MNWDKLSDEGRLHLWSQLRFDIRSLPLEEQLDKIAEFCSTMPSGRRTLDCYNPESWPTPWETLFYGQFCKSSISLIIFYTLAVLNKELDIEPWVVKDNNGDYLLPVIDNQFILNYEAGKVSKHSDVCDYFIVMQKFSKDQIKTIT
jgi:hypothetical protein